MTASLPPGAVALDAAGLPYRLFTHEAPVRSLEEAAEQRGQSPDQVVRSLLFRLSQDEYALILVAGPQQIPWKELRAFFGQSRLTMADPDEVLRITGSPVGAVGPFGLASPVPVYIESRVHSQPEVSIGSGRRGTAIILSPSVLRQALPRAQMISLF